MQNNEILNSEKNGQAVSEAAVERLLLNVGLCVRARSVICGTDLVCDGLKSGSVKLVIAAYGNSPNTAKRLKDRCAFYKVKLIQLPLPADSTRLAFAAGRGGSTAAIGITNASMVKMIEKAALPLGI